MKYIKVTNKVGLDGIGGGNPPATISVAICYWGNPGYSDSYINIRSHESRAWPRNGTIGFILSLKLYDTVNSYFVMPEDEIEIRSSDTGSADGKVLRNNIQIYPLPKTQ